jgi:uncharacterized protein YwqG
MNYKLEFPLSPELEKYRDRIEATIKPYIEIQTQNNDDVNWWQSKFGGLPYLPKGFEYPKTPDGKYLFLLAQLNFYEIPPLDGFPDRGILQFYIADDDFYGLDLSNWADVDNPTAEDRFKIMYFPQPDFQVENIITNYDFLPEPELFPVHGCCGLQFTKKYAPISTIDYQFTELLGEEIIAVLKKVRYALCPMPYALCPMPYAQSYLIFLRKAITSYLSDGVTTESKS